MSAFADALVKGMVAQMDPAAAMEREAMQGYLEVQRGKVQESKGDTVVRLSAQLIELEKAGHDENSVPCVAIKKLIHSLSE